MRELDVFGAYQPAAGFDLQFSCGSSLLLTFVMLGSHWLRNYVYAFAVQSWLIAALSACVAYFAGYPELYLIAVLTALFRGLVLPFLLMRIISG